MSNKKNNSKKSSSNRRNKNGNNIETNISDKIYLSKKEYEKNKKKEKKSRKIIPLLVLIIGFALGVYFYLNMTEPSKVVKQYFKLLNEGKYEEMYDLVSTSYSKEEFVNRVKNIYEGINASDISITVTANSSKSDNDISNEEAIDSISDKNNSNRENNEEKQSENKSNDINQTKFNPKGTTKVSYTTTMNTVAGNVTFSNSANVKNIDGKYLIDWNSSVIFPDLDENEKIKVRTIDYTRGSIKDRNDKIIAKDGEAYSVGLVNGKVDSTTDLNKLASLLNMDVKTINDKLNQKYASDNIFIELKKISKEKQDLKLELLKIKGVMITDVRARVYPYKEATSTVTGYVQNGEGKSGIELALNDKLKGEDGKEIYIDKDGTKIKTIAEKKVKNGVDIKLTIDAEEQKKIYDVFKDDKSAVIKINYNTGEIIAMVSTPTYDANTFSVGITDAEWENIKNGVDSILFNKCLATFAPGSTMKPIIGAIGLETNSFTASEDFGKSNLKWQKDSSWGDFYITTLEKYNETSNLQNALVYSDNIYFAKAALKIGKDNLKKNLDKFGFNEKMDFVQDIQNSTYGKLDSDKAIANTGYGQGEVMVNPIFMASVYSSFANGGTMCKPYIIYEENKENKTKIFKQNVITEKTATEIKNDLEEVVKRGTAKECYNESKNLYGKTGTAEIKASQDDKNGTENGWFDVFDDDGNLFISMCEDVKNKNGSHYVLSKIKGLL